MIRPTSTTCARDKAALTGARAVQEQATLMQAKAAAPTTQTLAEPP
jgi:hypothetical protein